MRFVISSLFVTAIASPVLAQAPVGDKKVEVFQAVFQAIEDKAEAYAIPAQKYLGDHDLTYLKDCEAVSLMAFQSTLQSSTSMEEAYPNLVLYKAREIAWGRSLRTKLLAEGKLNSAVIGTVEGAFNAVPYSEDDVGEIVFPLVVSCTQKFDQAFEMALAANEVNFSE